MMSISDLLLFPLRGAPFFLVTIFTLLLALANEAGLFGLWLGALVLIFFFKYCFRVADYSARGEKRVPELEYEDVLPFYELRPLKLVFASLLYFYSSWLLLGKYPAITITTLCFPVMIWILIAEDSLFSAVNPIRLVRYIWVIGPAYLWVMLGVGSCFFLLGYMMEQSNRVGSIVTIFIFLYVLIMMFHLVGSVLYRNKEVMGFEGVSRENVWEQLDEWQQNKELAEKKHHWIRLVQGGKAKSALEDVKLFLKSKKHDEALFEALYLEFNDWENKRLSVLFTAYYAEWLFTHNRKARALQVLEHGLEQGRSIKPENDLTAYQVSVFANENRKPELAFSLLHDFEETYPQSGLLSSVIKLKANILCYSLQRCEEAARLLEKYESTCSDQDYQDMKARIASLQEKL